MRWLLPLLLLVAGPGAAQETPSLAIAVDAGPAIPLGDFTDDGAELGLGLGASATLRLGRLLGMYGSFERTSFDVDAPAADSDNGSWTDNGFGAGARLWLPVGTAPRVQPWVQAGVGIHYMDAPLAGPEFADVDTDGIVTFEAGAGVDVALSGQRLFLRPILRYRRYTFEVDYPDAVAETSIASLTLGLGIMAVVVPR